jgi:hypothetical protein
MAVEMDQRIKQAFEAVDFDRVSSEYREQNECVLLDRVFSDDIIAELAAEADRLRSAVYWHRVPFLRSGGTIGYKTLIARAPVTLSLYRAPAFVGFVSRLVGRELFVKSEEDEHSCAMYFYGRKGDHVRAHYDTCGCDEGASFTVIVGLVDRSSSRLECHLHKDIPGRVTKKVAIATRPGSVLIFNGSKLFHGLTPLGPDEERIVLSLSYVTDSRVNRAARFQENLKDALLYFGLPAMLQRNYSWGLRPRKDKDA